MNGLRKIPSGAPFVLEIITFGEISVLKAEYLNTS